MHILVTGATGFIGRCLVEKLLSQRARVSVLVRSEQKAKQYWPNGLESIRVADFTRPESIADACRDIDLIFHLAGYAHAIDREDDVVSKRHETTTVDGTRALLADALRHGVRRVVYASSVKAMGEGGESCLDESNVAEPLTAYGRSRLKAETLLLDASRASDFFKAVIVRFPLVYGRGNDGNLARMIEAVDRGRFPPLAPIGNRRSMVWVGDAVQALLLASQKPAAEGNVYLATDGQNYSTDQIYAAMRKALGKSTPAWALPVAVLRSLAWLGDAIGFLRRRPWVFDSGVLRKLTGSACYRSDKIKRELQFSPRYTLTDALPEMVEEYRSRKK